MTLRELRYLVALAQHRHFGRAAEACNVTQPTLSAQLRKLEDYLGVALIDRSGKQPQPTPLGEQIVLRARRLLSEADDILMLTRRRGGPLQGAFNVGIIPTLAPYYLPWLLPHLRDAYPGLHLVVHEDTTPRLEAKLTSQLIDAAFLALPAPTAEGWVAQALFDEPFFLACPEGHPAAQAEAVPAEQLASTRLLLLTDGHCLRGQALAACHQTEADQHDGMDCRATSLETLRQLVAAGMGCTLLPALAAGAETPGVAVRPLAEREYRRIGLVWRAGHPRSEELRLLAEALASTVPPQGQQVVTPEA